VLVSFDEALARVLAGADRLGTERVAVELAAGRVLAETIRAPLAVPAFTHATMDGYALATASLAAEAPWRLEVAGESRAGAAGPPLAPRSAQRIFTGAPLPAGADAVVMQEDVERDGDAISVRARATPGDNVRVAGSDLAAGAVALEEGLRLHPGHLGLAASLDRPVLSCARRPVVAVVATGDELRRPGEPGPPESIAESNGIVVGAIARSLGAETTLLPFARDALRATVTAFEHALATSDVLVTIGGASVGDHDLVRPALEAAGARLELAGVRLKPGKPFAFARRGAARVLCLPGNPASATLTFLLFGAPLVRALQGERSPPLPWRSVALSDGLARRPGRLELARARLRAGSDPPTATLLDDQASGAVTSFARAELLVELPADRERFVPGERLRALALRDLWLP
jgi:molybdopterin molybdotransferase